MGQTFPDISDADGGFAPDGACALHAPAHLNAAVVTNGHLPRALAEGFCWADFAPGDGLNAAIHAAANPGGRFFAPGCGARGAALAAHLDNLSCDPADLPPIDFAVCDGGLAQLGDAARAARIGEIAAALKPGGILLLGYHALPGFAAMMPLRDLLHSLTADHEQVPARRVAAALDWAEQADAAGSRFLADHPAVRRRLAGLARLSPEGASAELFGPHLKPFHFAQVETSCRAAGLAFAGNARLFLNMLDLAVRPEARALLKRATSRSAFETLRDGLRNPFYRRDVYVKGTPIADEARFWKLHDDLIVGLVEDAPPGVDLGGTEVAFDAFPFAALREGLAGGPRRVAEIPGLIPEIARDAVRAALGLGLVRALPSFAEPAPPPEGDRLRVPHPLNRALLADALHAHGPLPLASVAIGGFVEMRRTEAIALDAIAASAAGFAGAEAAVVARLMSAAEGHSGDLGAAAALHVVAREGLALLTPERLVLLARLGVVEAF